MQEAGPEGQAGLHHHRAPRPGEGGGAPSPSPAQVVQMARILAQRIQLATPRGLSLGVRDIAPKAAKQLAEFVLERVEAA